MEFRDLKKQYEQLQPQIDAAIKNACNDAHFISGPQVEELEHALEAYVGVRHCITCANGTDALTLALMAWNIGPGDAVFVPDFTFFASGECPAYRGAVPIFVDVEEDTFNMSPDVLEKEILRIRQEGKYIPRVVLTVDLFGQPADYERIIPICKKYNLLLLEDGAQGFGGMIQQKKACSFGDISTTSFFPAKPLGCYGDGGAVFTNNDEWAELIRSLAIHGKCGHDKYNNIRLGMNSRLDTIQAAILQVKFKAFQEYELDMVNQVAGWYNKTLENVDVLLPKIKKCFFSSWAQYTVQLSCEKDRVYLQKKLKEQDIPTMIYYAKPMHKLKAFAGTDSEKAKCDVTEGLCNTVLSLPIHPYLNKNAVDYIADILAHTLDTII